jgi:hypothetical protein
MPLTSGVQRVETIAQRCGERSNSVRTGGLVEGVDWGCGAGDLCFGLGHVAAQPATAASTVGWRSPIIAGSRN